MLSIVRQFENWNLALYLQIVVDLLDGDSEHLDLVDEVQHFVFLLILAELAAAKTSGGSLVAPLHLQILGTHDGRSSSLI